MHLKFEGITKRGYNRENAKSLTPKTAIGQAFYPGIKRIHAAIGIIDTDVPDTFEPPFGSTPEVDSQIEPMVCRERDVIRLLVNQFRFAGIRCARERRSVYILVGTVARSPLR